MAKYRFTRKAVEDLSDIWHYTLETWSQKQADRYYRMLIECCRNIAEHPLAGRHYAEVAEGVYVGGRVNISSLQDRRSNGNEYPNLARQ